MIKSTEVSDLNHSATGAALSLKCLAQGHYMAEAGIGPNHDLSVVSPFSVSKPGSPRFSRRAAFFFCVSWVNKFSNCHKIKFPLQSSTWFRKMFLSMINHCHQKNRILITAKLYPTRCRQSHILYFAGKIFMTKFFVS